MQASSRTKETMTIDTVFSSSRTWQQNIIDQQINEHQQELFAKYLSLLLAWNERINLTGHLTPNAIITSNFCDSLAINGFLSLGGRAGVADVGSGGGFPGLPLAICHPEVQFYLIEVTAKKIQFLHTAIEVLGLTNVAVVSLDWRTFLRTTDYAIDLFCARASLPVIELARLFRAHCAYRDALLVYWASKQWTADEHVQRFLAEEKCYRIGSRQRRLLFFRRPTESNL